MKRKLILKITLGFFAAVLLLAGIGALFLDEIFRRVVEHKIRSQTGMEAHVGKVRVGLTSPTLAIENVELRNNAKFGGGPFLVIKELSMEYDLKAARKGKLRLPLLKINISEINQVVDEKGASSLDEIGKKGLAALVKMRDPSSKADTDVNLDGVDRLVLTLGKGRTIYLNHPEENEEMNFGVNQEVFSQVNTEGDLGTLIFYLGLKTGGYQLLNYMASTPLLAPGSPTNQDIHSRSQ